MNCDAVLAQYQAKWRAEYARNYQDVGELQEAIFYQREAARYYKHARQLMEIEV